MGTTHYIEKGDWRLKVEVFAGGGFLGIGASYGAVMESFQRVGGKWKKRNVPYLGLNVYYHGVQVSSSGGWHAIRNPKAGFNIRGDGDESDDNEVEVVHRSGHMKHPQMPWMTLNLKGVEAKGRATLPNGQSLVTHRMTDGDLGQQHIFD